MTSFMYDSLSRGVPRGVVSLFAGGGGGVVSKLVSLFGGSRHPLLRKSWVRPFYRFHVVYSLPASTCPALYLYTRTSTCSQARVLSVCRRLPVYCILVKRP